MNIRDQHMLSFRVDLTVIQHIVSKMRHERTGRQLSCVLFILSRKYESYFLLNGDGLHVLINMCMQKWNMQIFRHVVSKM
jgi:hypothetical protein